jgi:hypothetical protein
VPARRGTPIVFATFRSCSHAWSVIRRLLLHAPDPAAARDYGDVLCRRRIT